MSGKKQETKTTYGWQTAPTTAADTALDAETATSDAADPSIAYRAARQKNSLRNRLSSVSGSDYSPETSEAIRYAGENEIDQESGQAYQQDAYNRREGRWQKRYLTAQMRRPTLVSTGGTVKESGGFWQQFALGAVSAAV